MSYPLRERESGESDWQRDERQVTNDSRETFLPGDGFVDGFPVGYACGPSFAVDPGQPTPQVKNMTVNFDYEILVDEANFTTASEFESAHLSGTEWGLLWAMAASTGIINQSGPDCQIQPLRPSFGGRRLAQAQDDTPLTYVIGFKSLPRDYVPDNVSCQSMESDSDLRCLPVSGSTEVQYVGDDKVAVERYVLSVAQIELDEQNSLVEPVQRTAFIPSDVSNRSGLSSDQTAIVASTVAGAAALLVIAGLFLVNRRRQTSPHGARDMADVSTIMASNVKPSPQGTSKTTSSSPTYKEASAATLRCEDDISSDDSPSSMENMPPDVESPTVGLVLRQPDSGDSEVSSNSRDDGNVTLRNADRTTTARPPVVETVSSSSSEETDIDSKPEPVVVVNPFLSPKNMPGPYLSSPDPQSTTSSPFDTPKSAFAALDLSSDLMVDSLVDAPGSLKALSDAGSDEAVRVEDGDDVMTEPSDEAANGSAPATDVDKVQTVGGSGNVVDFLPPLPPGHTKAGSPSRPQQATRPRRKKKKMKKKKNALVRINSRESINEMASIPEEDDSYQDEELGSEYSWTSDDESSHGRASRGPSPIPSTDSLGSSTAAEF